MNLKILSEPKFQIFKDENDFIFYNSVRHFSSRLSLLDLSIFNLIYSLKNLEDILVSIPQKYHEYVKSVFNAAISCRALDLSSSNSKKIEYNIPKTYYIHLTYKCNLDCIYCYNKKIRSDFSKETTLTDWKIILDKILPHATNIVLTGGEPFLSKYINEIILYIKDYNSNINIEIISNGMVDFRKNNNFDEVFTNITRITFSCDNLSNINQPRIHFKPDLFKKNIHYLKCKYPNLPILVSSVYSCVNFQELEKIKNFCNHVSTEFKSVLIVPGNKDEINLLPPLEEFCSTLNKSIKKYPKKRMHCGAAIGVISINPKGDVYPCQSLMNDEFFMGSLMTSSMDDIMQSKIFDLFRHEYCVDNIDTCKDCNVKYICAAGCRAATINIEGSAKECPKTLCRYYKEIALNKLRSIPPMDERNLITQLK